MRKIKLFSLLVACSIFTLVGFLSLTVIYPHKITRAVDVEDGKLLTPNSRPKPWTDPEAKSAISAGPDKSTKNKDDKAKLPSKATTTRLPTRGSVKKKAGRKQVKNTVNNLADASLATVNNSDRWVVFVCNGRRSCGGWGDRQRALVGVYLLALATGRRFALILTRPCNITQHYLPNLVPWDVPWKTLETAGQGSNITMDDMNSKLKITPRLRFMDFNAEFPQRVVYIRTNGEYWKGLRANKLYKPILPDWSRGSRATYFATAWNRLMKPSPSLQRALDAFLRRIHFKERKQPLVCAHVRVGRSATFKRDTTVRTNITTLPVLWNFLQRWVDNGSHVFLATDSYEVRNLTRQRFGARMLDTGEKIMHVDQRMGPVSGVCEGFGSALLDQLVLAHCDVLVTSHSIFSERASYLRGRSDNLFTFMKGVVRQIFI